MALNRKEMAEKFRKENDYNCAQAVLCAFEDLTGLDRETALAITDGFGGGMRCGQMCGAVSGGIMAMGIVCKNVGENPVRSPKIRDMTKSLTKQFSEKEGYLACHDLLASTKERQCDKYILDTVEIIEKILEEDR